MTQTLLVQYRNHLKKHGITAAAMPHFERWLRYFLDYCGKYQEDQQESEQVRLFLLKLQEKNQSDAQMRQAAYAVSLYRAMVAKVDAETAPVRRPMQPRVHFESRKVETAASGYCEAGYAVTSASPEWDEALAILSAEIKLRHYSRRTLKTYATWCRNFQKFLKDKIPKGAGNGGRQGVPDLLGRLLQGRCLHSKPGFQRTAFPVPSCLEEGVRRTARRAAGQTNVIPPHGAFT
jgi:hypothetical protein